VCKDVYVRSRNSKKHGLESPKRVASNTSNKRLEISNDHYKDIEAILLEDDVALEKLHSQLNQHSRVFDVDSMSENSDTKPPFSEGVTQNYMAEETESSVSDDFECVEDDDSSGAGPEENMNKDMRDTESVLKFREYVEKAKKDYKEMSLEYAAATELMHLMNEKGGSLVMFESIVNWFSKYQKAPSVASPNQLHRYLIE
jgi:hypothetical protein